MSEDTYWVYVLASRFRGTLYVGVTNALVRRVTEHRTKAFGGFTAQYGVHRLVYFRGFGEITAAIRFEKQLKRWRRDWKVRLIEADNPNWADLFLDLTALPPLHPDIAAALEGAPPETNFLVIPVSPPGEDRDLSASVAANDGAAARPRESLRHRRE